MTPLYDRILKIFVLKNDEGFSQEQLARAARDAAEWLEENDFNTTDPCDSAYYDITRLALHNFVADTEGEEPSEDPEEIQPEKTFERITRSLTEKTRHLKEAPAKKQTGSGFVAEAEASFSMTLLSFTKAKKAATEVFEYSYDIRHQVQSDTEVVVTGSTEALIELIGVFSTLGFYNLKSFTRY